ncbi:hypothetical protein KY330_03835 [Candidatus Woesearchaeota archaeon]|nr:hypothetical protein [Candidatus Woesearchaeota archaeon]
MTVDEMVKDKDIVEEEETYQSKARYWRNKFKRCPAQREESGEFYCSRSIPCEYASGEMFVKEPGEEGKHYAKCKFIERWEYVRRG